MARQLSGFLLLVFCLLAVRLNAQEAGSDMAPAPSSASSAKLQVGVGFQATTYIGDLTRSNEVFTRFYPGIAFAFQLSGRKLFYPSFNFGLSKAIAQDRLIPQNNGTFSNRYVETSYFYFSAMMNVRFLRRFPVKPMLGVGVGILSFSPKDMDGNNLPDLTETRAPGESYGSVTPVFPMTVGVVYDINSVFSVGLTATYVFLITDYFDNVGKLGARSGPDSIQNFQLTTYISLNKRERKGRSTFFN